MIVIALVGKFGLLHDEEYIARSFETLGCEVIRIEQSIDPMIIHRLIVLRKPDVLMFTKWEYPKIIYDALEKAKEWNMKTVCWLFDLYWGYEREFRIKSASYFKAQYVITTDGGHDEQWKDARVNHFCVRQGIYAPECYLEPLNNPKGILFVGSENVFNPDRNEMIKKIEQTYGLTWYGRTNTNQVRGKFLNKLFSEFKIVLGDSVYSPNYWSNRVVETLGRGGFLIHRDVPGLAEEYPYLTRYDGTYEDLCTKIDYYLEHEDERLEIVKKNHEWVKERYTMDKKCQEVLNIIT